jgi:hypothetical protein
MIDKLTKKLFFEDQRRDALQAKVSQIRYTHPIVSSEGAFSFDSTYGKFVPIVNPAHPFYREQHEPFLLERYEYARPPIDLGHSRFDLEDNSEIINVLRMPIKFPKTNYRLPVVIQPFWKYIQRIADYEAGFNERVDECFVHITIDSGVVDKGTTHRYPGFHGDGVQGSKFSQKSYTPIEHSYIYTSQPPTEFCIQPFFLSHLNDGRNNLFHEMEIQAREQNVFGVIPYHIYLIDPYMVHRTPTILESVKRIFVRITFAYSELMSPHNTTNPLFPEQVYEDRHDVRQFLTLYPAEVPWEMYGLSFGPISR